MIENKMFQTFSRTGVKVGSSDGLILFVYSLFKKENTILIRI